MDVTEYKEIALIAKDNQYYPVIENGTVLDEKVANPNKKSPYLRRVQRFSKNQRINKAITISYHQNCKKQSLKSSIHQEQVIKT